jgi:guanylate kinase
MRKLTEILKSSSLSATMSPMEIEEISEEIRSDFQDYLDSEKEQIEEDYEEKRRSFEHKIDKLETEVNQLKETSLPQSTLRDTMTLEWIKQNWDHVQKIERMNKGGKEILQLVERALYYEEMGKEVAPEVAKSIDASILLETILLQEIKKISDHKRIILVGKAASGKDHTRKLLESKKFTYAVSYTTRPPRSNETDGKDYIFLSVEEFEKMIANDEFYEYVTFNGWYYGTSNRQFFENDIFIMTPYGISKINEEDRKKSIIIFFDIEEEVRKERLSQRSDADIVDRRLVADAQDFENFTNFDIRITNSNF